MAFRFRRSMKIAPGVRLNLTKTGISARVGPRGLGVTTGTSGTTVSAGIPGTGLHASKKLKSAPKKTAAPEETAPTEKSAAPSGRDVAEPVKAERIAAGLGFLGWSGVAFWVVIGILGIALLLG